MVLSRVAGVAVLALLVSLFAAVPALAADATVDITDFAFDPPEVSVEVGESVTWTNNHFDSHTVTASDGSYDYWLDPGDSVTHTYTEEAYEPYFCALHGSPDGLGMAGAVLVGDVEAPPPPDVTPLAAADNIGAAIAWSQRTFAGGAQTALLGRDDLFADSLSSGAYQGLLDAPLLLNPTNELADRVRDELRRLGVEEVILFGGTSALGPQVAEALRAEGYTLRRMRGSSRVGTAVNAAARLHGDAESVILARAFPDAGDATRAFADSLAAGSLAAMTLQPVLLTATESLSPETRDYLSASDVGHVTIVGGTAAVGEAVQSELEALGMEVERVFGRNRFATATAMLDVSGPRRVLTLIDGSAANAWAAGFPAASAGYPVLLTDGAELPAETLGAVVSLGQLGVQVLCGPFLAGSACTRARDAASATGFFSARARPFVLEGRQETAGGHEAGSGEGGVYPTSNPRTLCYEYELFSDIGEVTGAHIHKGVRGQDGPVVVPLSTDLEASQEGRVVSCAFDLDRALVTDILTNHADYYVNVHTTDFPAGALRGQLFDLAGVIPTPLTGDQEPSGGDPDGDGFAVVIFPDYPGELCVLVFLGVSSPTTASHIHEGPAGENGPPVITLRTPPQFGADAGCYAADQALIDDIRDNPAGYYVNVHTDRHPGGAIRGQLG